MGYEELVDTLIAEGHKEVSFCSNTRRTDDSDNHTEVHKEGK